MRILKTLTEPDLAGVNSIVSSASMFSPLWLSGLFPPPGTGHWAPGEARREIQVPSLVSCTVFLTCPPGVLLPASHTRTP